MVTVNRGMGWRLLSLCAGLLIAGCATVPAPPEIKRAELAVQDAKAAGAETRAQGQYESAVTSYQAAEKVFREDKDVNAAVHLARLAEARALDAQARSLAIAAAERLEQDVKRRRLAELDVKDAELILLQVQARTEAEKRAAEAAREAQLERRRYEEELAQREASVRELEKVRTETRTAEEARRQQLEQQIAELERIKQELAESKQVAAAESRRVEEQRKVSEARAAEIARLKGEQENTLAKLAEVRKEARGLVITLPGSIYFDTDRATLKPALKERLAEIAKALSAVSGQTIRVEGHTDSDGTSEYNVKLSELRANAVRVALVEGGVPGDAIEIVGYGETRPRASNTTSAGKAQNRRVEIVVKPAGGMPSN